MTKKTSAVSSAFGAWIDALVTALPAPPITIAATTWRANRLETKLGTKKLALALSAPCSVVAALWGDDMATVQLARDRPPGQWNRVLTVTRCEGVPQERYLELVAALHADGATTEAQLAWIQARTIQDKAERADGLFAELFAAVPAAAKVGVGGSVVAIERVLGFATSKSAVDRMIVAEAISENAVDVVGDMGGARRARFVELVDRTITRLTGDPNPCITDAIKLARIGWARALAYS